MLYTVVMANELVIRHVIKIKISYQNLLWPQWRMALLQLTTYHHTFWTDYLIFFCDESLLDVDDRNNNDVGKLSGRAGGKTDTDSESIFDGYSDSDDECDGVNSEDELRTVLSMLDGVCESVDRQSLIGISPVAMNVSYMFKMQINNLFFTFSYSTKCTLYCILYHSTLL